MKRLKNRGVFFPKNKKLDQRTKEEMGCRRFYMFAGATLLAMVIIFSASTMLYSLRYKPSLLNPQVFAAQELSRLNESSRKSKQDDPITASCTPAAAALKVFMYDLPPEFHFGMIAANSDGVDDRDSSTVWPNITSSQPPRYFGGLHQQHSVEYWLTLDLLASNLPHTRESPCTAVRVDDPLVADVFFVPYFSSLSYNKFRNSFADINRLERRLVDFLKRSPFWLRNSGSDHVILMHHPNSMHYARSELRDAMFVVADFGRMQHGVANLDKDVVAPYKHVIPTFDSDKSTFETRETNLFFQGAIVRKEGGVIRQQLHDILIGRPGVVFLTGNTGRDGIRSATNGMRNSKFCLHPAGDTPSSNRLFDAAASHCVPVIVSDEIELPFEDVLDYSQFCVFVESKQAVKEGVLLDILDGISREEWTYKWERLKQVSKHFEYQYPAKPDDAVHMIWNAIARRLPQLRIKSHKIHRYRIFHHEQAR